MRRFILSQESVSINFMQRASDVKIEEIKSLKFLAFSALSIKTLKSDFQ